ncbi:MAG: DNA translocase FtsK [Candidatus Wolfebacteria bacterium]|nr:DNA translocase FtsK [Candidatus Wolfebacteria bacterium]
MSRKNKNKYKNGKGKPADYRRDNSGREPILTHELKKSIWALVFFGIAVILILARFNNAGPVGEFFYGAFRYLFGVGYYLLPLIFLILSGVFMSSERRRIYQATFWGALIFVLSGLGLIDVIYPDESGLIGKLVGYAELPFGYVAAIIVLSILIIAALLVTFNLPINLKTIANFRNKEKPGLDEEFSEEEEETIEASIASTDIKDEKRKAARKNDDAGEKEEDLMVLESSDKLGKSGAIKKLSFKNYVAPPLSLLKSSIEKPTSGDLRANANIIKRTFEGFGINVEMSEINVGPKFTRYTLKPAEGVKLSRIMALNQDLALVLAAHPIRIEAPIPGRSLVGVEVPNKASAIVRLGSLMVYPEFNAAGLLGFILGRDVSGDPIFGDIEKMPHLLIAGSSGSGKSIAIQSLLISLLYKNSPETLRLILIDPKRVELSVYDGIPHLVSPVITNPKKSMGVFRWLIDEMDRRYETLLQAGSRDIQSYNKKHADDVMPYIVLAIDELADLMATYGREIEGSIVRLAQMARATGIHLILSTQRPSVEVITGLIKANITSRIALQLPSQVDSRTILDSSGAEKLLGGGDMLFVTSEISKPKRIQGAYISEEEINKVITFIKENTKGFEGNDVSFNGSGNAEVGDGDYLKISGETLDKYGDEDGDDLLGDAVQVVTDAQKASASLLQRRLKVGYARAARLLDIMEAKGIIGPGDGAKPREVFLNRSDRDDIEA